MGHLATPLGIGLVVLLAGVLSPGCNKYPNCKKDKHCRQAQGEVCVDKTCQNCKADADCVARTPADQPPWVCHEFRCQAPGAIDGAAGGGEEGDPCVQRTDCYGGLTCREGSCAMCTDDVECSPSTCNLETGRCSPEGACTTDDQCAMDEICDGGMCVFSGNLGEEGGGPCGLAAIYFAFDSNALTPKAQDELTTVAACMTEQGRKVLLEAHADDRGTEEYNILLTERRGIMVRTFLSDAGVPADLMQVLAKGSLEAIGSDEPSRAQDRRVSFIWPE